MSQTRRKGLEKAIHLKISILVSPEASNKVIEIKD
jgi:hypothetical protein